ncbi:hypothetical protein Y1Q_0018970 [Alligator mississippiensis]|uniref:Uncharacterized protein n=1 Tax=Alligator mississippiensis TaxID=8496 RepID=A0A151M3B6_ALLMI|nr:hypothetical protein Y1Q_0018970 [Alligator mississippiensis]
MTSQGHHSHAPAAWNPSGWLDPGRDADDMLLDGTAGAAFALLRLQPCWLEAFRMTQAIFWDLLEQHQPHLEWQTTSMWPPLPVDTQLALTWLKLAIPTGLWYVSHLFGMDKAIVGKAILELCGTLQDILGDTVFHLHNILVVVVGFHTLGFRQCKLLKDNTERLSCQA